MKKKILSTLLFLMILTIMLGTFSVAQADGGEHEVTFMLDENTPYGEKVTVAHEGYLEIPETPEVIGKVFLYWQTEDGKKFSFATPITEPIVLTAKWEEIFFTVTFMVDGEPASVQQVEKGKSAIAPNSVTCPEGKYFVRWDQNTSAVQEDMIVNAILNDIYYTVDVYADGEHVAVQMVKHGEDINMDLSQLPQKPNYYVKGLRGQIEDVTANGIAHVVYAPQEYKAYYHVDGEITDEITVYYGETAKMPITLPEKAEHYFVGWGIDSVDGELYDINTLVEGDLNLYAKFAPIEKPKYEVRFYDYKGEQYGVTQEVREGNSAIEPVGPQREGYKFIGWAQDFDVVTQNIDVYPMYLLESYTVVFKDYLGEIASETVLYGQSVAVDQSLVRVPEGYEFVGFDRSLKSITGETVINAVYRIKTYSVTFYSENYTSLGGIQTIKYGQDAKAPNVEKEGFDFLGWKNLKTGEIEEPVNITKNADYIAQFARKTFTITFMEGETVMHTAQAEYGRITPMYTYQKEGYVFGGWYLDEGLNAQFNFSINTIKGDMTFYAKWTETVKEMFDIKFYIGGTYENGEVVGGELYNEQKVEQDGSVIMPPNPYKEGYTFRGWRDAEKSYFFHAGDEVRFYNESKIFIAEFDRIVYNVTFIVGDNNSKLTVGVNHGEEAIFPDMYSKEKTGHTFEGWDKDTKNVTSNMTIKAVYKPLTYTVTFKDKDNQVMFTQSVPYGGYCDIVADPSITGWRFDGWYNNTDYRDFTFDWTIKKDTTITASFTQLYYKLTFYLDGVKRTDIEQGKKTYYYGESIYKDYIYLNIDTEKKKFLGWSEIPDTMPAHDVDVYGTTYTYQKFKVYYRIDGEVWKTIEVREGKQIPTPSYYDVPNDAWLDAHETVVFKGWGEQPAYMPTEDVYVDAIIQKLGYYKVYYYLDDALYKIETYLEGKTISAPSKDTINEMYDETKIFSGWSGLPHKMPANDLEVHGEFTYKNYYNLNYYVNGELYKSFSILEGTTIEGTDYVLNTPKLPSNMKFQGWSTIPQWMPKRDCEVRAYINVLEYFTVRYYVDMDVYREFEVLEGEPIPTAAAPVFDGTRWFVGWKEVPSVMPERDINIYPEISYLNNIVMESHDDYNIGEYTITLKITGVVDFVALRIKIAPNYIDEIILDERYASYNRETNILVWASGEKITEETVLITFKGGIRADRRMMQFFEIYTIDEDGEIVKTVMYSGSTHEKFEW